MTIEGTVVSGHQLGRKLGYPTANLGIDTLVGEMPAPGVYAAHCRLADGRVLKAMLNVGYRPTVEQGGAEVSIEAHLLDFDEDLYGQRIQLKLISRIRDERRMVSLQELREQLARDLEVVRQIP